MKPSSTHSTASLGFGIAPKTPLARQRGAERALPTERKPKILLVDPDLAMRRLIGFRLATSYAVQFAGTAQAALQACVRSRPNLVITELRLQDMGGVAFLKELKSRWPHMSVIVLTAHGTISEAVKATQHGAFGYLVKPIERGELLGQVQRAIASSTFNSTDGDGDWRAKIVSRSQLMEDRLSIANQAANSDVPVLLTGENGTGKELLARAIHAASTRRARPFVVVTCKDRPRQMLEAELFGGDSQDSALQRACGGTLLLEEIGDLPSDLQVALARALTNHSLPTTTPDEPRRHARLICTTSRDLQCLVDSGVFFLDLFHQINILPIEIPPLGRRREDIPLLVSHFLERATETGGQKKIYSPKAIELLVTTDWPGNVRQLFEMVKQHVALSRGKVMTLEFVQQSLGERPTAMPAYDEARETFSHAFLAEKMQRTGGNVSRAAQLAKRSRTDFYKLLARHRVALER